MPTDLPTDDTPAEIAAGAKEPEPWPGTLPERARAVRRVLHDAAAPVAPEAVARTFRRAPRREVTALLDTLVELGQARQTEAGAYAV